MKHFIDLGTHKFEGLAEFTELLQLDNNVNVYCFEPNKQIYDISRENDKIQQLEGKYYSFKHFNLAVMDYTGEITFNTHVGEWKNNNKDTYIDTYTTGSNCLDINPTYDSGNGVVFDIKQIKMNCIDIEEIISSIVLNDSDAEIIIKCDIEGSEFVVLPKLLNSKYINTVKTIFIEWHERFWLGTNEYQNKVNLRREIVSKFNNLNIPNFVHT